MKSVEILEFPFPQLTTVGLTLGSQARADEAFAALLLIRWASLRDAELAAMAVFNQQEYKPLLPAGLQWQQWAGLDDAAACIRKLQELGKWVGGWARAPGGPLAG